MRGPFRISRVARSAVPKGGDRPNEARYSSDALWLKGMKGDIGLIHMPSNTLQQENPVRLPDFICKP